MSPFSRIDSSSKIIDRPNTTFNFVISDVHKYFDAIIGEETIKN